MHQKWIWVQAMVLLLAVLAVPSFADEGSQIIDAGNGEYLLSTGNYEGITFTEDEVPGYIAEYQSKIEEHIKIFESKRQHLIEHFEFETSGDADWEVERTAWLRDTYYPWYISFLSSYKTTGLYEGNASDANAIEEFWNMKYPDEPYSMRTTTELNGYYYLTTLGQLNHFQASRGFGGDGGGGIGGLIFGGAAALVGLGVIGKISKGKKKKKAKKPKKRKDRKKSKDVEDTQKDIQEDVQEEENDQDEAVKLTLSKKMLPLLSQSGTCIELKTSVVGSKGDTPWTFDYEKLPEFTVVKSEDKNTAKFSISEKYPLLSGDEHIKEFDMEIRASRGSESLSRVFRIVVGKEGMFLCTQTPLKIIADMETVTDLRIAAVHIAENQFQTDYTLLSNINFKFVADDFPSIQMFKAAKVDFNIQSYFEDENLGVQDEYSSISYKLKTEHALPSLKKGGDNTVHTGQLLISSRARNFEDSIELSVELHPPAEPSRSQRIEEEYKNCIYIIDHYVKSPRHQKIFKDELNQWKELWGPEQIYKFRHEVWNIAQKLILAEGAEGYDKMADYYDQIAFAKKWTMWAGDIAFEVVLNAYTGLGPQGVAIQAASGLFKDTVISAIEYIRDCWVDGEKFSAEAWFDMEMEKFIMGTPGHIITAGTLKGAISGGKAIVYMMVYTGLLSFVNSINWSKWGANWENDEIDLSDLALDLKKAFEVACEEVGQALLKMGLIMLFSAAAMKSALRKGAYVHPDHVKANAPKQVMDKDVIQDGCKGIFKENSLAIATTNAKYTDAELPAVIKRMEANAKNGVARPEDVLAILSDTEVNASRTMKKVPERLQKMYDKARRKIYKDHDQHLIAEISKIKNDGWCDRTPDGRLMPPEFRITETTGSSLSQDRDFVIEYRKQGEWFEVSDRYWKEASDGWWLNKTGKTAEQHNQMAMTRHGSEASLDYANQKIVGGKMKKVTPNISKVYKGEAILVDSISLSAMWIKKVKNANCKAEAIAQIKKMVYSREKIVKSYKKQGVAVPQTDLKTETAIGFMKLAADDMRATPEYISKLETILSEHTGYTSIEEAGSALALHMGEFKCQNRM